MRVNVRKVNTYTDLQSNIANLRLTIEIHNIEELVRILARLNNMPNIINTSRIS